MRWSIDKTHGCVFLANKSASAHLFNDMINLKVPLCLVLVNVGRGHR